MCRHGDRFGSVLERHGGGLVGISAAALEENDYRRLLDGGLCWSVLWQETYDKHRYAMLHSRPGKRILHTAWIPVNECSRPVVNW
jgi:hypothetical protein